jgi:hypothetical protein
MANLQVVKGRVLLFHGPAPLDKTPVPALKKQGQLVAKSKKGAKKQVTSHTPWLIGDLSRSVEHCR